MAAWTRLISGHADRLGELSYDSPINAGYYVLRGRQWHRVIEHLIVTSAFSNTVVVLVSLVDLPTIVFPITVVRTIPVVVLVSLMVLTLYIMSLFKTLSSFQFFSSLYS
jgi:hypothetical protein